MRYKMTHLKIVENWHEFVKKCRKIYEKAMNLKQYKRIENLNSKNNKNRSKFKFSIRRNVKKRAQSKSKFKKQFRKIKVRT